MFAFARLATAIPFTPGGAVLLYRALTWLLPIPVGIGCYLWWRRRSWVAPATTMPSPVGAQQP